MQYYLSSQEFSDPSCVPGLSNSKIVFYGLAGSPPTEAHKSNIVALVKGYPGKTILVVPSASSKSPDATGKKIALPDYHRYNMLNLIIDQAKAELDQEGFQHSIVASPIEMYLNQCDGEPSKTFKTIVALREKYDAGQKRLHITLAMGADSFDGLYQWSGANTLLENVDGIAVFGRAGEHEALNEVTNNQPGPMSRPLKGADFYQKIKDTKSVQIISIDSKYQHCSSTRVREILSKNPFDISSELQDMISASVLSYINAHKLCVNTDSADCAKDDFSSLNIANTSVNLTGQNWGGNLDLICSAIDKAFAQGAHVLSFGELTLTGPDCQDNFQYFDNQKTLRLLQYIAGYAHAKNIKVSIGHPWYEANKALKNTVKKARQTDPQFNRKDLPCVVQSWLEGGKIMAMTAKTTPDKKGDQRDDRYFQMQDLGKVKYITIAGETTYRVPFGSPVISTTIEGKSVTFAIAIGGHLTLSPDQQQADVILNPHAVPSVRLENQNVIDQKKIDQLPGGKILVVSSTAPDGHGYTATHGKKIKEQYLPLAHLTAVKVETVDVFASNTTSAGPEAPNEALLEMNAKASWLLNYLQKSKLSSVIQAFSGGVSAVYNAAKIRYMVDAAVDELGVDGFKKQMGYVYKDCQTADDIMKIMLTCVYFSDDGTTDEECERAKKIVESIGGAFESYDIQPMVNEIIAFYEKTDPLFREPLEAAHKQKVIADTKDRVRAMVTAQMSNKKPGSVCISNTTLDKLCLGEGVYGGHLHGGQLAPNGDEWRETQTENLKKLFEGKIQNRALNRNESLKEVFESEDLKQKELQESGNLTAAQIHQIFFYMLHHEQDGKKNNPTDVFQWCLDPQSHFTGEPKELVYQKIKRCYEAWAKAQVGIHSAPLSSNYNYQAVNHDNALRTPNINGFHRQELAQLAVACLLEEEMLPHEDGHHYIRQLLINRGFADEILKQETLTAVLTTVTTYQEKNTTAHQKAEISRASTSAASGRAAVVDEKVNLKIASVACNQTGSDWGRNVANIRAAVDKAVADGADLLCFQELVLSGYDCEGMFQYHDNTAIFELLKYIADYAASKNPNLLISLGHPWKLDNNESDLYNVQTLLSGGEIHAMSAKKYLYDYARGHEGLYFVPWDDAKGYDGVIEISLPDGQKMPFGSPVISVKQSEGQSINIFHSICEESWIGSEQNFRDYAEDNPLAQKSTNHTITVCINPNASPPAAYKWEMSRKLAEAGSAHCDVFVHANSLGTDSLGPVSLGTTMIAQKGEIIAEGPILRTDDVVYSSAVVKVNVVATQRNAQFTPHASIDHQFQAHEITTAEPQSPSWLKTLEDKLKEVAPDSEEHKQINAKIKLNAEVRMEILWLFDYMRKNKVRGFTQALSGGADSAYNAVKVRLMVQLVIQERGLAEFLQELHYPENEKKAITALWSTETNLPVDAKEIELVNPESKRPETPIQQGIQHVVDHIMQDMLTCTYLGTSNSSEETKNAATWLINGKAEKDQGVGGKYVESNIQPLINACLLFSAGITLTDNNGAKQEMSQAQREAVLEKLGEFFELHPKNLAGYYNQIKPQDARESHWPGDIVDWSKQESNEMPEAFKLRARKKREEALLIAVKKHFEKEIKDIFKELSVTIGGAVLSPINPAYGLTIENMQARIREVYILMITDFERKQGFSNPNLNEAIRGYTTFLGDLHSGHIAPNAHKHKFEQLEQMRLLCEQGLEGLPPVVSLHQIIHNPPSAELQPQVAGAVAQFDEDAMGCTYEQNRMIAHEMLGNYSEENRMRKKTPIEVFQALKSATLFSEKSTVELYEILFTAYKAWAQTQYKLRASPPSTTNSDLHYGDHKKSLQTPCINAHHAPELGQLTLYCIAEMAKEKDTNFESLTGRSLQACMDRVLVDNSFAAKLEGGLWAYKDIDALGTGRERRLGVLYEKIKQNQCYMDDLFEPTQNLVAKIFSLEKGAVDVSADNLPFSDYSGLLLCTSVGKKRKGEANDGTFVSSKRN